MSFALDTSPDHDQPLPLPSPIEQPAGPAGPDGLPSLDLSALDRRREQAYRSYEAFLREALRQRDEQRPTHWHRDYGSVDAYLKSIEPMRQRLRRMFGWWVEPAQRVPLDVVEQETLFEDDTLIATRYSFQVMAGLRTYAVEMYDKTRPPRAGLLAQHGYAGAPETIMGFGPDANGADYSYRSLGLRAARHGFRVVAVHHPTSYGQPQRMATFPLPGHESLGYTYGKNRLHRLATLAGGTLFGLDLMASSRGVDLLIERGVPPQRIGMYGLSQGGQSTLYLPAIDPRIHAAVTACYFNNRYRKMLGPVRGTAFIDTATEDKIFSEVIGIFADSDAVSLIAPRAFAVEAGRRDAAVDVELAWPEFQRAADHYRKLGLADRTEFILHEEGHVSATARAFEFLISHLMSP